MKVTILKQQWRQSSPIVFAEIRLISLQIHRIVVLNIYIFNACTYNVHLLYVNMHIYSYICIVARMDVLCTLNPLALVWYSVTVIYSAFSIVWLMCLVLLRYFTRWNARVKYFQRRSQKPNISKTRPILHHGTQTSLHTRPHLHQHARLHTHTYLHVCVCVCVCLHFLLFPFYFCNDSSGCWSTVRVSLKSARKVGGTLPR